MSPDTYDSAREALFKSTVLWLRHGCSLVKFDGSKRDSDFLDCLEIVIKSLKELTGAKEYDRTANEIFAILLNASMASLTDHQIDNDTSPSSPVMSQVTIPLSAICPSYAITRSCHTSKNNVNLKRRYGINVKENSKEGFTNDSKLFGLPPELLNIIFSFCVRKPSDGLPLMLVATICERRYTVMRGNQGPTKLLGRRSFSVLRCLSISFPPTIPLTRRAQSYGFAYQTQLHHVLENLHHLRTLKFDSPIPSDLRGLLCVHIRQMRLLKEIKIIDVGGEDVVEILGAIEDASVELERLEVKGGGDVEWLMEQIDKEREGESDEETSGMKMQAVERRCESLYVGSKEVRLPKSLKEWECSPRILRKTGAAMPLMRRMFREEMLKEFPKLTSLHVSVWEEEKSTIGRGRGRVAIPGGITEKVVKMVKDSIEVLYLCNDEDSGIQTRSSSSPPLSKSFYDLISRCQNLKDLELRNFELEAWKVEGNGNGIFVKCLKRLSVAHCRGSGVDGELWERTLKAASLADVNVDEDGEGEGVRLRMVVVDGLTKKELTRNSKERGMTWAKVSSALRKEFKRSGVEWIVN